MKTAAQAFCELAIATNRMRNRQRNYFKKPSRGHLIAAKIAEKIVDDQLDEINGVQLFWPLDRADVETETHA